MYSLSSALKRLAEGEFVCAVAYPDEFAALQDAAGRAQAETWLEAIGYRLARLSDEGAFFMAHGTVTTDVRAKVREELRTIRDRLQPAVEFLETLRQAQGRSPQLQPGDTFWESEIVEAVRGNVMLERRMNEMRDVHGARVSEAAVDRVKRILALLEQSGYLKETNPNHKAFQVTGKVLYVYQLLAFVNENTPHLADSSVVDQVDAQPDLLAPPAAPV
ncbi:MAG: hypothetical protein K0Q43_80 [Ramlibacter sp.]|jgi:hypothetical protein|nr:hypothetical protein [Ramlibacter sp.]